MRFREERWDERDFRRTSPLQEARVPFKTSDHRRTEDGSISTFLAVFALALFALMGLVLDGGSAINAQQTAYDEAEQAARAGAGALSVDGLRTGSVTIDSQAAIAAAVAYTVNSGHPGTASVANGRVTVEVHYRIPTSILGIVGMSTLPVSATASAINLHGVAVGV
ncbi:MAG TPA: Tad domain-containing protein [Acidimicrobiales bacterium]|jgi:Flp pilus assembly protein TadG|nr:Tad domain-containing protein [Acidimicrobiales bacterium]